MHMRIRGKLLTAFLAVLLLGAAVSVAMSEVLRGAVASLRRVVSVDGALANAATETQLHTTQLSDVLRGYLFFSRRTGSSKSCNSPFIRIRL
jgi:hypothetical protein